MNESDPRSNLHYLGSSEISSVFITWIKLMSKELSVLIIWPSKQQVNNTLPACFKKLYPSEMHNRLFRMFY